MNSRFNRIKASIFLGFFVFLLSIVPGYAMAMKNEQKDSISVTFNADAGSKFVRVMDLFLNTTSTPASSASTYTVKLPSANKYSGYMALYSSLSYVQAINGKPVVHVKSPEDRVTPQEGLRGHSPDIPGKPQPSNKLELIIRLKPNADPVIADILSLIYEFKVESTIKELNAYLIQLPDGMDVLRFVSLLKLSPYVSGVELNQPVKAF